MKPDVIPLGAPLRNQRGATLFAAILALLLLSTMTVAFTLVARDEMFIGQNTREAVQAEFSAEGGASHGRWLLAQRLRVDLPREVANTLRTTMINDLQNRYNTSAGAALFLLEKAIPQGAGPTFSLCSTAGGCPEPVYTPAAVGEIPDSQQVVMVVNSANPQYAARVIVGVPPGAPPVITNGGTGAIFNYMWRVDSTGTAGRSTQLVSHDSVIATLPAGTFTIALNSSFVQYAHFIDQMDTTQAWISFRHIYTGPVHTNTRFNILGNPTGPTFRAEATQTLNTTYFNNGGSATTVAKDSTANDWPLLGPDPGVLCKSVDCTGFTRNYDFDPSTPAVDPIPFPAGPTPTDRTDEVARARGVTYGVPPITPGYPFVWVANDQGALGNGTINGGIFVQGPVFDLQLNHVAGPAGGQHIVVFPQTAQKFTDILENRAANTVRVRRYCRKAAAPAPTAATACAAAGGIVDINNPVFVEPPPPVGGVPLTAQDQTLTGKFTPDFGASPPDNVDFGVMFVNGAIGVAGQETGLRQTVGQNAALYQDPLNPNAASRFTIAANGNIYITGHLRYQVDSRGLDGVYGSPAGSGDDQLQVQNVLGVVSWQGGIRLSSWLSQANLAARYPGVPGTDLLLQGMFMAPNINNAAAPNGQVSFEDPNGAYRGFAKLLGGVVQKTMGTFGSPGTPGTGYARDWVYDERFRQRGLAPPLFPGFGKFTASTSLGIDDYTWRMGRF